MRRALLGCVAALLVAAPAWGAEPYGLVASNANFVPGDTVELRTAAYKRLYDAGVRAIRVDINWSQVEPLGEPLGDYDFSDRDRDIRAIRAAGLQVIGILAYGHPDYSTAGGTVAGTPAGGGLPPFGVGSAFYYPPDDPADFARYARATVERYRDDTIAWEIWNEQNEGWRFWAPHEDPPAYARLLCEAHAAVKAADPSADVLYGGVFFPAVPPGLPGLSGPDFLQATYDADPALGRCFDAMAYHPYPYPFTAPELDVPIRGSVLAAYDQMRAVLKRNGDGGKPLWITEVGWPTHDPSYGVPEAKQAEYVGRMQAASFAQGVPVLTWYTYGDYADPSGVNQEAWFGFFRPDGSPKPSYIAVRTFSEVLAGTRFARDRSGELGLPPGALNTGGRGFALEFAGGGRTATAVWLASEGASDGQNSNSESSQAEEARLRLRLPVDSQSVVVVSHLGEPREVRAEGGAVQLELGPAPQYVVADRSGRARPRLRLRLRHRTAGTALRRRCVPARARVRARVVGPDSRLVARAAFFRDRRLVARDLRAPFARVVDRGGHRGRPHRHRIGARVLLRDGRRARLVRRFLSCGSPT